MASADDLAHGRAVRPMLKAAVALIGATISMVLRPGMSPVRATSKFHSASIGPLIYTRAKHENTRRDQP
jgi:hypothetical protein